MIAPKLRELLALLKRLATVDNTGDAAMVAGDLQDQAYIIELEKLSALDEAATRLLDALREEGFDGDRQRVVGCAKILKDTLEGRR